jgi:xanthosine utilization system XapX-like protein
MREPRVLRPMEYGEFINEAFDLYKRDFSLFAGIGAIVYIPYSLFSALIPHFPVVAALGVLGLLLPVVAAQGAMIKALADRYLGREATIGGSWLYVLRRLVPYLITSFLAWLLVMVGFMMLCAPGIIFAFWIFLLPSIMIVEDRYYMEGFRRSRQLAAGMWERIFVIGLLTVALYMGVAVVAGVIVGVIAGVPTAVSSPGRPTMPAQMPLWASILQGSLNAVLQSLLAPITSLLAVLLYFDIRVRKEGFDIELLAQEMDDSSTEGGPSVAPP